MSESETGENSKDIRRGRPTHALGGGARKDHLFTDKTSLCGKYMWGGGREIDPDRIDYEEQSDELCKSCAQEAGIL